MRRWHLRGTVYCSPRRSRLIRIRNPEYSPATRPQEHEGLVGVLVALVRAHLSSSEKQNALMAMHSASASRVLTNDELSRGKDSGVDIHAKHIQSTTRSNDDQCATAFIRLGRQAPAEESVLADRTYRWVHICRGVAGFVGIAVARDTSGVLIQ